MKPNSLKILHIKKCFIVASKAEPIPPLGTILGNLGVSSLQFCENFNNITNNLPSYFLVKVIIIIFESKTFNFQIKKPTASALINLLKFSKKINDREYYFIKLKDLIQIAIFKFPNLNLQNSICIIWGTIKSNSNIYIEKY